MGRREEEDGEGTQMETNEDGSGKRTRSGKERNGKDMARGGDKAYIPGSSTNAGKSSAFTYSTGNSLRISWHPCATFPDLQLTS